MILDMPLAGFPIKEDALPPVFGGNADDVFVAKSEAVRPQALKLIIDLPFIRRQQHGSKALSCALRTSARQPAAFPRSFPTGLSKPVCCN
jgi:hypothetical protein